MKRYVWLVLILALVLSGCAGVVGRDATTTRVLAEVRSEQGELLTISDQEFVEFYRFQGAISGNTQPDPVQVLNSLITQRLALASARAKGVGVDGAEIDRLLKQIVTDGSTYQKIDDFACQYTLRSPEALRAVLVNDMTINAVAEASVPPDESTGTFRHILFQVPPDPSASQAALDAAWAAARAEADQTYQELQRGADFVKLAQQRSDDEQSLANEAKLQPFPVGTELPGEIAQIWGLQIMEISKPLQSEAGIHIFQRLPSAPSRDAMNAWMQGLYQVAEQQGRVLVRRDPGQVIDENPEPTADPAEPEKKVCPNN